MIAHNLTLAWRQLVKYRLQSAVSIISLAIGFACFALASMWIKYETTYDAFHKDAENLYIVRCDREYNVSRWINVQKLHEMPQLEQLTQIYQLLSDSINGLDCVQRRLSLPLCANQPTIQNWYRAPPILLADGILSNPNH